jgi:CRISPR/Cas system-associated protein Csm6
MVNSISEIAKKEHDNNLFINITCGTNLMAGASCATSYFVGAQAYYIKESSTDLFLFPSPIELFLFLVSNIRLV